MIWSGLKAYAEVTDTPVDCTKEDCYDWVEEMLFNNDVDTINAISEAYLQSSVYKATEEAKKKTQADLQTLIHSNGTLSERSASDLPTITI
jgi:hypothetical protein